MNSYLCICGSPREQGNSDILAGRVIEGAKSRGMNGSKFYAHNMNVKPCIGCLACDKTGKCGQDDWKMIEDLFQGADAIIFSTAIYGRLMTGPLKCLIDRLRPFMKIEITPKGPLFHSRFKDAKYFTLVTTNSSPDENEAKPAHDCMIEFFEKINNGRPNVVGVLNGCGLKSRGQVAMQEPELRGLAERMNLPPNAVEAMLKRNQAYMKEAFELGVRLADACQKTNPDQHG